MSNPLVSICCITYNHAPYIRQCLDGFLMQQCDFEYEIIINDDASTDGTREILLEYQAKHPDKFVLSLQDENQYQKGVRGMFARFVFPKARGKYLAMCEGDDYWTDPLKLQKQVTALEDNPNIDICGHPSFWLEFGEFKNKKYGYRGEHEKIISPKELIANFITVGLQSILIRNKNLELFKELCKPPALGGHSSIQLLYGLTNGLYYIPDYMATYRSNSSSSISKALFKKDVNYTKRQLGNLISLDRLNKIYHHHFNNELKNAKRERIYYILEAKKVNFVDFIKISLRYNMFRKFRTHFRYMKKQYF